MLRVAFFVMMDICRFLFPGWSMSPIHDLYYLYCKSFSSMFFSCKPVIDQLDYLVQRLWLCEGKSCPMMARHPATRSFF